MAKIEFENKQALNENANIPDINKVKDSDLNEIKNVVNQTILNSLFGVYFDSWQSSETYSIGDIVIYDAILYENLTGTNTETTPDQDSTNWQVVNILLNTKINPKLIDKTNFIKNARNNSQTDTYSCDYINGEVIYDNTNGTSTDFTLDSTINNYRYVEVYYRTNDANSMSCKKAQVQYNATTLMSLDFCYILSNALYYKCANISINGTSATFTGNSQVLLNGSLSPSAGNYVFVFKIIGYK